MILLFYYLILCLTLYCILFYMVNWKYILFSFKTNGWYIPVIPLFGNAYISLLSGFRVNLIAFVIWLHKNIGFPATLWFGQDFLYFTADVNEVKTVLNHRNCRNKAVLYEKFKLLFDKAIMFIPHELWKPRRQHYAPNYKPTILRHQLPVFYERSCEMVKELRQKSSVPDLFIFFGGHTFVNFFLTSVGIEPNKVLLNMERLAELLQEARILGHSLQFNPALSEGVWLKFHPDGRAIKGVLNEINKYINLTTAQRRQQHQEDNLNKETSLLDLMFTLFESDPSRNEIIPRELFFFLAAATDTTACSLAFIMTLLGMHPDVQEKVFKEVQRELGYEEITYDGLSNLKYTEAVICESLRVLPVIPIIGRICDGDLTLGTKTLPEGTSIMISVFHVHRDPKLWPNPLQFNPDRFLPENQHLIKHGSFLPFSLGSRDCIGKPQAMIAMKTTVANIVRNLKITSSHKSIEEFQLDSFIDMRTTHQLDCHFTPRT